MSDEVIISADYLTKIYEDELLKRYKDQSAAVLEEKEKRIAELEKFKKLVEFIANDYHELSHDKASWQRNDWKKRCKKLLQEGTLTEPEKGFEDYNFGNLEF